VDAFQPAPAEYYKDRDSLVYIQSTPPSASRVTIRIGTDKVMPVSVVRHLGIYMDADVSMSTHVSKTVAACFASLRQLRSIRRSVPRSVLQSLVSSLNLQQLDYGNATLSGIPSHLTKRMQTVLNSATTTLLLGSCFLHRGTTASRHS